MNYLTELIRQVNLFGAIIVYFGTEMIKQGIKNYIPERYRDPVFLGIAVLFAIVYGVAEWSFLKGLSAFAGAQVIHALIKKGVLFDRRQE